MLKALSHPVRLDIFQQLTACGEANCIDFTRQADLAQSTISEHLRVLKESGLIQQCGPGPRSGYCINRAAVIWMKQAVIGL
jgi:ArsR family transcriptional regulator